MTPLLTTWVLRLKRTHRIALVAAGLAMLSACSYKNHLPAGEKLYLGADVRPETTERVRAKKQLQNEAEEVVRPEPNSKFLGMRLRLGIYNGVKEPKKKKGFRNWLKYKVGEPPVLYSQVNPYLISQLMDARLFNLGVFNVMTSYELKQTEHSVKVIYRPRIHQPYRIDSISWPEGEDDLNAGLREGGKNTSIKLDRDYNLDVLTQERGRLDSLLKSRGFFYFSPDYIAFDADTTRGDRRVALSVRLKDDIPYAAGLVYRINDVFVYPDYSLTNDTTPKPSTVYVDSSVYYITRFNAYRPRAILRSVFIKKDDLFSRRAHEMTLNRVMGLGIFKYANIRYFDADTNAPGFLNAHIYLSPLPRKSLRLETDAVSKSNNYIGPQVNLVFRNRNTWRGAEAFALTFHGTYETQITGTQKGLTSYSFGPQVEFIIPRFVTPFNIRTSSFYQPQTRFLIGYEYVRRAEYFSLNSTRGSFGYRWRETLAKSHEFNPIDLNYIRLSRKTATFDSLLTENPLLRRSYQEQFIAGLFYSYTYNEKVYPNQTNQFYFNGNVQTSGNSLYLGTRLGGNNPNPSDPIEIAGAPFAQFLRTELDVRNYYNLRYGTQLAGRVFVGVGVPYGNSDRLPYIRQFFSGGPNSVRAFPVRSLGPGIFVDSTEVNVFTDQGGDIKLEANAEYRFPIYSIFKGAVFADAGNAWLIRQDTLQPGGTFAFNSFSKEIAVGAGLGLRVDANFFVLRVDLAMPLRKPWRTEGDRWVFNEINFGSGSWRAENLIVNIAIGYPF